MSGRGPSIAAVLLAGCVVACGGGGADVDGGGEDGGGGDGGSGDAGVDATPPSCDPVAQDGCSSEQKCTIVPSAIYGAPPRVGCVPDQGVLGMMAVCQPASPSVPDQCQRGLVCVGSSTPRCLPFCDIYPDTCGADQVCAFSDDLDGDLVIDVRFCALSCDVLLQDCGDPELGCYPTREASVCAPEGAGETPAQVGEPCEHANSCQAGLGCFQIGLSDFVCLQICDPYGSGPQCDWWMVCNPVEDEPWGVCIDAG